MKVRGFRIELDEVAAAIRTCGWPTVCVFKRGEGLSALVERRDSAPLDEAALRLAMADHIEQHAIPETIRETGQIPRNENDKLEAILAAEVAPASTPA